MDGVPLGGVPPYFVSEPWFTHTCTWYRGDEQKVVASLLDFWTYVAAH